MGSALMVRPSSTKNSRLVANGAAALNFGLHEAMLLDCWTHVH